MASNYIISCCSTADVSKEYLERIDVKYICFHYYVNGVGYRDDFFESMAPHDFYQSMVDGAETKTSQINADEFIEYFTPFLEAGQDVFHCTLSSGISGVLNSALVAADELREKYPDRKIIIVDSLTASAGYGLFMAKMAELRDSGMSIEELERWAVEHRVEQNTWFFSTDLTFFVKGGRISKASGWFGTALNICPLLNVNCEGALIPRTKHRGKKLVKKAIVDKMKELAADGVDYTDKCVITHSDCYEDAREVADMIEATFPKMSAKVEIFDIGTTIGSHTGPGTVAVGYWGQQKGL